MGIAASSFLNPIAAEPEFVPVLPDTPECAAGISDRLLACRSRALRRHGTVPPPHYRCLDQN